MAKRYIVDEFLGKCEPTTIKEEADKKIYLLRDFHVLKSIDKHNGREKATKKMLRACQTKVQLDNIVHDLITGKCTLNEMLARKGF